MPASIFTFKAARSRAALRTLWVLAGLALMFSAPRVWAASDGYGSPGRPEEDDFSSTPYTEYGEFNEDEDEAQTTQYLQYGRFFGVSLGVGTNGATGNRGSLWEGGFPVLDFKIHYWFNFNFALQMGFTSAPHTFTQLGTKTDVRLNRVGVDLKYYFDTRDVSSAITFAGPYLFMGAGNFTKTQTSTLSQSTDHDSSVGLSAGAGFEFTASPKKVYFFLQGGIDLVTFKDTNTTEFQDSNQLSDLSGMFYTAILGVLFTW